MAYTDELIQGITFRPGVYIRLGYIPAVITRNDIKNQANLVQKLTAAGQFKELGAVQRLEINSTREVNVWRELDYFTAGKPVESFPGLVTYDLTLERVVLYESNLMEAFNSSDFDIMRQNKPLTLQIEMPGTPETGEYAKTWYVYGVWFKGNPMTFDITKTDDVRIIQTVDAVASGVIAAGR
jgi:hypothetical protein